eukprot:TRINITY_DN122478_c0_g1_i1.p1 TRINITY_DN122478_c0_g1~~TRINITY_DN122478_c0_g1_i1.p1  ORF type:complete len:743 (+),score=162.32 TRINITY_DN122478_c0_g1_i1:197-2230(+)
MPAEEVSWESWQFGGAVVGVLFAGCCLLLAGYRSFVPGLAYLALLAPTLGVVGRHIGEVAADRYCHLACMLLGTPLLAALLFRLHEAASAPARSRLLGSLPYLAVPLLLGLEASVTRSYVELWASEEQVVEQAVAAAPRYYRTRYVKGFYHTKRGELAEAEKQYRQSIELWPGLIEAHFGLTEAVMRQGRSEEAIAAMRAGAAAFPESNHAHGNLGRFLAHRPEEAVWSLRRALDMGGGDPDLIEAYKSAAQAAPQAARDAAEDSARQESQRFWKNVPQVFNASDASPTARALRWLKRHPQQLLSTRRRTLGQGLSKAEDGVRPYLSWVIIGRNDNYGGEQEERFIAHVAILLHELAKRKCQPSSELIYVEWNPPADRPSLESLIHTAKKRAPAFNGESGCDSKSLTLRVITVPPSVHEEMQRLGHVSRRGPMAEYFAKNVGARHARGEYIMGTNYDSLFSPALFDFFAGQTLKPDAFYSISMRFSTEKPSVTLETPLASANERLANQVLDDHQLIGTPYLQTRFYKPELNEEAVRAFDSVCAAGDDSAAAMPGKIWDFQAGDFILAHASQWRAVGGYPEISFGYGVDSCLFYKFAGVGLRQVVLLPPCFVVHQFHAVKSNPNSRKIVEPEELNRHVFADSEASFLHSSQRDPLLWGEHDNLTMVEFDYLSLKSHAG